MSTTQMPPRPAAVVPGTYLTGPFAPDPRADGPEHGWWLAFANRFSTGESSLLVLPSVDPASGPVATVTMPVRVPLGLHGNWMPTE